MSKLILDFESGEKTTANIAHAYITLETWGNNDGGAPQISCQCVTAKEVENEAKRLKQQLDAIVAKAKIKFANAEKIRKPK